MTPKRIILVRHGRSEANEDATMYSRVPDYKISLVEQGREDAARGRQISVGGADDEIADRCLNIMDYSEIDSCGIRNLAPVFGRGLRGETLSASRNRRWVESVVRMGVRRIIDLRTADHSEKLPSACSLLGLEYAHVPVDSMVQSPAALAERLPTLFRMLDEDGFYISCQQGRHRTDIALALYYFFHNASEVPVMLGHIAGGQLRCDDIMRRVNAMRPYFSNVSPETFDVRRANFLRVNREKAGEKA